MNHEPLPSDRRSGQRTPPVLVSTLHDPHGILLDALRERKTALTSFAGIYVSATIPTDNRLIDALAEIGARTEQQRLGAPGLGRRRALEMAVLDGHSGPFLHCDFDRLLHWSATYPEELLALPERIGRIRPQPWFVCLGRTRRAYDTHPEVQRVAEGATNRALSITLGRTLDATAGSSWLTAEAAEIVLRHSTEETMGTDLEWPALVWKQAPERIGFLRNEGLEFETAAFATEAITSAGGISHWLEQTYQSPEMWRTRLQLAANSVAALTRALTGSDARSAISSSK